MFLNTLLSDVTSWDSPCSKTNLIRIKQMVSVTITTSEFPLTTMAHPCPQLPTNVVCAVSSIFTFNSLLSTTQLALSCVFKPLKRHLNSHEFGS